MAKTRQLHEILAVDGDRQNAANAAIKEATVTFQKKPNLFQGALRTVQFIDEAREMENTKDHVKVEDTVMDRLAFTAKRVAPSFDTLLTKEKTNQTASASVIVDGTVILEDVPGTFLLAMEKRLHAMRDMYAAIPTLQPGIAWEHEMQDDKSIFAGPAGVAMKTEKQFGAVVLYEATPEHPAQVKETSQDVAVARVETVSYSGMISSAHKAVIMGRLDKLIAAFKQARQRANTADLVEAKAGQVIFDFLHA